VLDEQGNLIRDNNTKKKIKSTEHVKGDDDKGMEI